MTALNRCFIAMPFRPELNFFFLYLQQFLMTRCGVEAERGDAQVLTIPLMQKIKSQIAKADLVIADITGANANVLYEVGVAHAMDKPVLFLTQDPPEKVPVDVRQFEYIIYALDKHVELLSRIENAIQSHYGSRYDELFARAQALLVEFNQSTRSHHAASSREEFIALVMRGERSGPIPADETLLAEFLLPKIIRDFADAPTIRSYNEWITHRGTAA